jgi:NAD(P)-dependent dehydrogenase (short-subunit alcohol dehydrogenase family)
MSTVLVVGGHAGLGFESAKQLAAHTRVNLLLAGRDVKRMEAAAEQLRTQYGVKVETLALDLNSLASVRAAAAQCRALLQTGQIDSLQAILLNAGAQFRGPMSYSTDGYEETFAVNCLGHFLLVNLLLDCVVNGGRIVFTASGTHDPDTMDGKMVGIAAEPDANALASQGKAGQKPLSGGQRYSTSKLCTILYAYELDRRLRRAGVPITSIAFDPGLIPETGLARTAPEVVQRLLRTALVKGLLQRLGVTMGSLNFSGDALAKVVTDPRFADGSGKYFQSNNGTLIEARSSKASYDEAKAVKLWTDSEQLVHLQDHERPQRLRDHPSAAD